MATVSAPPSSPVHAFHDHLRNLLVAHVGNYDVFQYVRKRSVSHIVQQNGGKKSFAFLLFKGSRLSLQGRKLPDG